MKQVTTRRTILAASGGILAGFAGCISGTAGSDDTSTQTTQNNHEENGEHGEVSEPVDHATVAVNTTDGGREHFSPHVTRITVNGTVTWVLESGSHTATAYHPDNDQPRLVPHGTEAWDSGILSEEGETFEHTFDTEGVYHYYCIPHENAGMIGTVIVGDPVPTEQVALQSIPSDKPPAIREKLEELNGMVRSAIGDAHRDDDGAHEESEQHTESEDHSETE